MILVVWTTQKINSKGEAKFKNRWEALVTMPEAEEVYRKVQRKKNLYIANICVVTHSTDYDI